MRSRVECSGHELVGRESSGLTAGRGFPKMPNRLTMSDKIFPPSAEASAGAHISSIEQYRELYERSINDPESFWTEQAERLHWFEKWINYWFFLNLSM